MLSPGKRCKSRNSRTAQLPRRFCTAMHFSAVISWQLPAMFQFVSVLNRAVSKRLECLRSSLRTRSFSLRAGIAYADAYAFLRTPGFFLCEVLIATLLLQIYVYKRYFFDVAQKGYESPKLERQKWCWNVNTLSIDSYTNQEVMEMSLLSLARKNLIQRKYQVWCAPMFISWYIIIMALGIAEVHNSWLIVATADNSYRWKQLQDIRAGIWRSKHSEYGPGSFRNLFTYGTTILSEARSHRSSHSFCGWWNVPSMAGDMASGHIYPVLHNPKSTIHIEPGNNVCVWLVIESYPALKLGPCTICWSWNGWNEWWNH